MLIAPNGFSFSVRRDTMICVASYLLDCKANHPKETSDAINEIIGTEEWAEIRNVVKKNDLMPEFVLKTVFSSVFPPQECRNIPEAMKAAWKKILSHVKTMDIIASLTPSNGFNYSVRDAHSELIANTSKYGNLIERNDDLDHIVNIMRSMGSELIGRVNEKKNSERSVLVVVDTSESMYGESEIISKGIVLALSKRMLPCRKNVHVILFSSDLPILSPASGKDLMELISYGSNSEKEFSGALKMLLERMRCGILFNTDLILVSKGSGIVNDPRFTRDWEAHTMMNGVRTITTVPGGSSACGLTELSEHVAIFDDSSIRKKTGEFAKLTDILS